eukprot:2242066-Pleurochrysis_carterae.AAC.1
MFFGSTCARVRPSTSLRDVVAACEWAHVRLVLDRLYGLVLDHLYGLPLAGPTACCASPSLTPVCPRAHAQAAALLLSNTSCFTQASSSNGEVAALQAFSESYTACCALPATLLSRLASALGESSARALDLGARSYAQSPESARSRIYARAEVADGDADEPFPNESVMSLALRLGNAAGTRHGLRAIEQ